MLQVKLPYYPQINAVMHVTRFGVKEIKEAEVYNQPLSSGKIIVRVDTLSVLTDIIGPESLICRDAIYEILSGESASRNLYKMFASFYRKYKPITKYVNDMYQYGDPDIPIYERAVLPLREIVNNYTAKVNDMLKSCGGKYLAESKDFVYYAFNSKPNLEELVGVTCIC